MADNLKHNQKLTKEELDNLTQFALFLDSVEARIAREKDASSHIGKGIQ